MDKRRMRENTASASDSSLTQAQTDTRRCFHCCLPLLDAETS